MVEVSKKQSVKVVNPLSGHSGYISRVDATRLVKRNRAKWDKRGCIEFRFDPVVLKSGPLMAVAEFCGRDAFPGRPILQPSPNVLQRMKQYRGPLVPPLRSNA